MCGSIGSVPVVEEDLCSLGYTSRVGFQRETTSWVGHEDGANGLLPEQRYEVGEDIVRSVIPSTSKLDQSSPAGGV